ncbi:MAG TPA: glutamate--tRNA ligase [Candidatus Saccharimonadales bacterium]
MNLIRTRFAPSPTGFLHVGNVRAALFPWLVARQNGGTFILRIEDTDRAREVAGAIEVIHETLGWLGLTWDEGPDIGGPHGPYLQTLRTDIYKKWAQKLIDKGLAYADPYTPEEVNAFRDAAKAAKKPFLYREHRPENPPTWDGSQPLRFKIPEIKSYSWHDAIMGDLSAGPEALDDFIIIKSDGLPTYNFAHIVDDYEMGITHVIRGLEYIASVPKYLALYEALEIPVPVLAHAPHIMAPDGKKKLGKRDGAKSILDYKEQGFLPEAMLNFLASLGWNDGTEQEIFSRDELIKKFSLERVQRSGARFDEQRLIWMNGHYIRELPLDELFEKVRHYWPVEATGYDDTYKKQVLGLVQERLKFFAELPDLTQFFFTDLPVDHELISGNKQLKKFTSDELKALLETSRANLEASNFAVSDLTERLNKLLEVTGQKPGVLFSLIRIATTQAPASPGLADTLAILGKDVALRRIDATLHTL